MLGAVIHQRHAVLKPRFESLNGAACSLSFYIAYFFRRFLQWISKRAHGVENITICCFLYDRLPRGLGLSDLIISKNICSLVTAYFFTSWFPDLVRILSPQDHHLKIQLDGNLLAIPFFKHADYFRLLQASVTSLHIAIDNRDGQQSLRANVAVIAQLTRLHTLDLNFRSVVTRDSLQELVHLTQLELLTYLTALLPGELTALPPDAFNIPSLEFVCLNADLHSIPTSLTCMSRLRHATIEGLSSRYPVNYCVSGFENNWLPDKMNHLGGVTSLTLSRCGILDLDPTFANFSCIKELDLSENGLRGQVNIGVLAMLTTLTSLNLAKNMFSHKDKLSQLSSLGRLQALNLASNVLVFLPKVLLELKHLRTVDLSGNHITLSRTLFGLMDLPALRWVSVGVNPSSRQISEAYYSRCMKHITLRLPEGHKPVLLATVSDAKGMWWTSGRV